MNIQKKEFGLLIKEIRHELGLTQPELAKKCGFSNFQIVSNYETGAKKVSFRTLEKVCKACGVGLVVTIEQ